MLCFPVEGVASFGEEDLTAGTRSIQSQEAQRMIAGAHLAFSFVISLEHKPVRWWCLRLVCTASYLG